MSRLTVWLALIGVSDLILVGIVIPIVIPLLSTNYPDLNSYNKSSLSFDGKMTFSDGKLTFFVDNNHDTSNKKLSIYGVGKKNVIRISASDLIDKTNNTVKGQGIAFNGKSSLPINNNGSVNISVPHIAAGSFQGWIFIHGKNDSSIPITIAADPKYAEASGWIIVGILTSILFWEIILYFKPAKPGAETVEAKAVAESAANAAQEVANAAKAEASALPKGAAKAWKDGASAAADAANDKSTEISEQRRKVAEGDKKEAATEYKKLYVESRYSQRKGLPIPSRHIVLLDGGTIVFGLVVGLLALLNQGYVNELRSIGILEVLALLGIGLTIGSIHSQS